MNLPALIAPIADDMKAVDAVIRERLNSDVVLIRTIGDYIIGAGGKRMRPAMVLMVARALGYEGTHHQLLAAVVEFIHTATLLHDDVVDESDLRRGRETANAVFGNAASVLVGDYLYSRSFEMMVEADSMRVMSILSEATTVIAEGEVLQLLNVHDPDVSQERYLQVVRYKTAKLFEANAYRDYLELHGLSVQLTEALAEFWHSRVRAELGLSSDDGAIDAAIRDQAYRGSRYSFGYPACPDLESRELLVQLLDPSRIGVNLSEELQLHPEQSTDAIIVHHPEAKYFNAR